MVPKTSETQSGGERWSKLMRGTAIWLVSLGCGGCQAELSATRCGESHECRAPLVCEAGYCVLNSTASPSFPESSPAAGATSFVEVSPVAGATSITSTTDGTRPPANAKDNTQPQSSGGRTGALTVGMGDAGVGGKGEGSGGASAVAVGASGGASTVSSGAVIVVDNKASSNGGAAIAGGGGGSASANSQSCAVGGTPAAAGAGFDVGPHHDSTSSATAGASSTGDTPKTKLTAVGISAGRYHTCALITDGSVVCWGNDCDGQIGSVTRSAQCKEVTIQATPAKVQGVENATAIAAGGHHTCALLASGHVRCWGDGYWGQLGDYTYHRPSPAVDVFEIFDATSIASGFQHSCALLKDGTVRCWGTNYEGELGDGTTAEKNFPVEVLTQVAPPVDVPLSQATSITLTYGHACVTRADSSVYCWGSNRYGELGNMTRDKTNVAVGATGISTARVIEGANFTCALGDDGTVRCWGYGEEGQLGNALGSNSLSPLAVTLPSARKATNVAAGWHHACAILDDSTAQCWGDNTEGQIGDKTANDVRLAPTPVFGLARVTAISGGSAHTCAVVSNAENSGAVYCWGSNTFGQLGDGTKAMRTSPVLVTGF